MARKSRLSALTNPVLEKMGARKFDCGVGLERESQRVTPDGRLALSRHPFDAEHYEQASYDRDFAESQLELVSPVCHSSMNLYGTMLLMHNRAIDRLRLQRPREYLWVYSNPPYIGKDIPVAEYTGDLAWKTEYRKYLSRKYGANRQLFSGIHYNFSFPPELVPKKDRNRFYLNLARHLYVHAYLPVMLLASSPVYDSSFDGDAPGETRIADDASIRIGKDGYWNPQTLYLDFSSVEAYADSALKHVEDGTIKYPSEIYLPVRLKSSGDRSMRELKEEGISYIEFRSIDLNPFDEAGIDYRDLEFLHLFMIYMASLPEAPLENKRQDVAMHDVKEAAKLHPDQDLVDCAAAVLEDMYRFYEKDRERTAQFLDYEMAKLVKPERRCSSRVISEYGEDYVEGMLTMFKERQK